ncbi:MAG: PDZ domain-containing protein [Thermocaproicibacter melissae]|jgi:serine protease Do|uniref:S1C family serine protease n=1 Tax=Thermocaproicibacter melissae TaxID=2966552 RepID=UPI0024B229E7|nr:trypsin-like peptidase domain-containing protein [Thermocaproicibacter melissae]WBY64244.1 trypsin-like peptidase domain-containing protein [Thermocaproicibacter melissae]
MENNPWNNGSNGQNPYDEEQKDTQQRPSGENPYGSGWGQNPPPYSPYGTPNNYNRYENPYSQPGGQRPWNPYGQYPEKDPNHKMSEGLKVFLWILVVIAIGLVGSFAYFSSHPSLVQDNTSSSSSSSSSASSSFNGTLPKDSNSDSSAEEEVIGGVTGDGTDKNSAGITIQPKPTGTALTASQVYKKLIQSVVGVETTVTAENGQSQVGEGTGIVTTSDGYILTNAHVVNYSKSNAVKVVLHNNKAYQAKVVGYDKTTDLAVLKINATGLSPATFGDANAMEIGEQVVAIGNPGGLSFAGSITSGIISALNRTIESRSKNGMTFIQTDAAINPGNSGGPLVNMYAQVIGINSNKIALTGYEGMGFAIPISKAQPIINQLIHTGYVSGRCRLGITAQEIGSAQAAIFGISGGVQIKSIASDSDVARAGGKVGDIITKAAGKTIETLDDLYAVLEDHKPGDTISLTIVSPAFSDNDTKTIQVKLLEDKGETQR